MENGSKLGVFQVDLEGGIPILDTWELGVQNKSHGMKTLTAFQNISEVYDFVSALPKIH